MDAELCWSSHPDEWQPLAPVWKHRFPAVRAARWPQYGSLLDLGGAGGPVRAGQIVGGTQLLAITLGAGAEDEPLPEKPFRLLVVVPQAHAPAGTAAAVNLIQELLAGEHRDGSPSDLDRAAILAGSLITLLPDGNPQGRSRSPERVWDGARYAPEEFQRLVLGEAADGSLFPRLPEWRFSERRPRRIGILYEQTGPDTWVEPAASRASTFSRAVDELFARYRYTHTLQLDQHAEEEAVLLPAEYGDLPEGERRALDAWAARLTAAWSSAGAAAAARPPAAERAGVERDYWAGRCPGLLRLTAAVRQHRHPRTGEPAPLARQFAVARAALRATLIPGDGER